MSTAMMSNGPATPPIAPPATVPVLDLQDLHKHFPVGGGFLGRGGQQLRAIDGLSLAIYPGEIVSLVGESGSGKSTVGRAALRLLEPTNGSIRFKGEDITTLSRGRMRPLRRQMQLVFQDPYASLNPRMTVEEIVMAPLEIHGIGASRAKRLELVAEALRLVGLLPQHAQRYPHEFSGGQRQRIGLARALVTRPDFIVADEPVSALDVSIQAQVVNLMLELRDQLGLTMLVIAHDLAVVGHMSDRVAVMYLGRVVEIAETRTLFTRPRHPYTEALLSAAPNPDPTRRRQRIVLTGDVPSPLNPPSGCSFRTRCRYAQDACAGERPPLRSVGPAHQTTCIRDDLLLQAAG